MSGGREWANTFEAAVDADSVAVKCAPSVSEGTGEAPVSAPGPATARPVSWHRDF